MSAKRASTRTAGVAAAAAALALGLFAASAVGWYDEETPPPETPTETTPANTTPTDTTPTETTSTTVAPAEVLPLSPPPVSSGTPAAPQEAAAPVPVGVAPEEGVRGETGTRDEGRGGGAKPVVLAQAADTPAPESQTKGQLAQTGFDILMLAMLGGLALAGSGLLFWRSRTA